MKTNIKPFIASVSGLILLVGVFSQTAKGQQVTETNNNLTPGGIGISGSTVLADKLGAYSGPEALMVNWSVVESLGGTYTYSYDVFNPSGDVILAGPNTGQGEIVDDFIADFNDTAVGAYVPGSQTGGTEPNSALEGPLGGGGVEWVLETPEVEPGSSSGALTFESLLAPSDGNASADDSTTPAPWAANPDGGYFPVPGNGSFSVPVGGYYNPNDVPDSANTMTLLGGMMLLLPFRSMLKKVVQK